MQVPAATSCQLVGQGPPLAASLMSGYVWFPRAPPGHLAKLVVGKVCLHLLLAHILMLKLHTSSSQSELDDLALPLLRSTGASKEQLGRYGTLVRLVGPVLYAAISGKPTDQPAWQAADESGLTWMGK